MSVAMESDNASVDVKNNRTAARKTKVWDLPVRLFHWTLVALLAAAWWSAETRHLDWHRRIGYALLTVIVFRLLWGCFGSTTARFVHFVRGPRHVIRYVRSELFNRATTARAGHNPLGGWSVLVLLGLLLLQIILGSFAVDVDGMESGPLAYLVSFDNGRVAAIAHHFVFNGLLGLIGLHVIAVLYYTVYKRVDLIFPMITGTTHLPAPAAQPLAFASLLRAFVVLLLSATLVFGLVQGTAG
jgi:cytochrome b